MDNKIDKTVSNIIEYMPRLNVGIKETAELFQRYEETKGTVLLCEIIDDMQWIIDALVVTHKLNNEKNIEVNSKLKDIVSALENEDYILVGDLLQYELLPVMEEVQNKLI